MATSETISLWEPSRVGAHSLCPLRTTVTVPGRSSRTSHGNEGMGSFLVLLVFFFVFFLSVYFLSSSSFFFGGGDEEYDLNRTSGINTVSEKNDIFIHVTLPSSAS